MNVNPATYSTSELLLRCGKNITTFSFLAQPAIISYAELVNAHGGIYIDGKEKLVSMTKFKLDTITSLRNQYIQQLTQAFNKLDKNSEDYELKLEIYKNLISKSRLEYTRKHYGIVFDYNAALNTIKKPDTFDSCVMLIYALLVFLDLQPYSEELHDLVRSSLIDTKKFGNTIAAHNIFINNYNFFKNETRTRDLVEVKWKSTENPELTSKQALNYYFDKLWTDYKLFNATALTRNILSKLLLQATDTFSILFNSVMYNIFGSPYTFNDEDNVNNYYQAPGDTKLIKLISDSIDAIARNNILFNSTIFKNKDADQNSGFIDFTLNNDRNAVVDKLLLLVYGDPNNNDNYYHKSIFDNYARFIYNLRNGLLSDEFNDLLDDAGNINNEFLNYYMSVTDNKFLIGRFTTKMLNINVDPNYKLQLESALDKLLTHKNEMIRRLFRDIVFYDYYSSYNSGSVNSIFDIVPVKYKTQYIYNITLPFLKDTVESSIYENGLNGGMYEYLDMLSRNFWYNDNIVNNYIPSGIVNAPKLGKETQLIPQFIKGKRVCGVLITSYTYDKPYIKINVDGTSYLYRKIGAVSKNDKKSHDVYVIVPKLGIHSGNLHQYEFVSGIHNQSIYGANQLPESFVYDKLISKIESYINRNSTNKVQYSFIPMDYYPINYQSNNYYTINRIEEDSYNLTSNQSGDIRVTYAANPEMYAQRNSTITIDVNDTDVENTVCIRYNEDLDSIIEKIEKALPNIDKNSMPITLYTKWTTMNIENTQKEIDDYALLLAERYVNNFADTDNMSQDEIEQLKMDYFGEVYDKVPMLLTQHKAFIFANSIIKQLLSRGYKINSIYSTQYDIYGKSFINTGLLNKDSFNSGQPVYLVLPSDLSKDKNRIIDIIEDVDMIQQPILYEEQNVENVVKDAVEAIQQLTIESIDESIDKQNKLISEIAEITPSQKDNSDKLQDVSNLLVFDDSQSFDDSDFELDAMNDCLG